MRGVARTAAVAGTASAVSGSVHHRQQKRWAAKEQQQAAPQAAVAPAPPPPPAAPAGGGDTMAQLQQLVDLKTQGLLTDEEFAAAKAKILAG